MSKIVWDQTGDRIYETGCDHGVIYPMVNNAYPKGYAWNGLSQVDEKPTGGEANDIYADNIKYLSLMSAEQLDIAIQAYTYPDEFSECDGSREVVGGVNVGQQTRKTFGFCYRTIVGNDAEGNDHGYKLHLVYNIKVSPSQRTYQTVNDNPEAISFSWEGKTTPVVLETVDSTTNKPYKPTASITIDSTQADADKLEALEAILYGTENVDARLPLPDDVLDIFIGTSNP